MDGMQMMMKALGVDPNAIMQAAGTFQEGLKKVMDDLATIKAQQEEILSYMRSYQPKVQTSAAVVDLTHNTIALGG